MAERAGVLFDVDGTLLDTNYLHALAWWQAMRDAGITGISMADTHQAIGIANEGLVQKLTGSDSEEAVEAHSRRYDALQDQVEAFSGAAELLRHCRDVGLVVVLATSGKSDDLDWMLPAIGVDESIIAGATTSDDVDEGKPAPDLLVTALRQHGLDPARTIAVGDTIWDIRAARDAGLRCIAFTGGGISRLDLEREGAVEVYTGPQDLLDRFDGSALALLS